MSVDASQQLEEARRHLRVGDRAGALPILKAILVQDRTHVEAWWLAAQAASNRAEAEAALRVVLKLQPGHPRAGQALARLQATGVAPAAASAVRPANPQRIVAAPAPHPKTQDRGRRNRLRAVAAVLSLVVMAASGALFVLSLTGHPLAQQIQTGLGAGDPATPTPALISSGAQLQGIVNTGQTLHYYFQGRSGTDMFVGVGFAAVSSEANTDGALELFDPDGYRVAVSGRDDVPFSMPALPGLNVGNFSVLYAALDVSGVWDLRLIGREGRSAGAFVLVMECLPEQACSAPPPTWQSRN